MTEGPNTPPAGDPQGSTPNPGGVPPAQPPPPGAGAPPPPAPAAPQAPAVGVGQPADLQTRIIARLIDMILLFVVNAVIITMVIIGAVFSALGGGSGFVAGAIGAVLSAAIYLAYFAFMESNRGQTVGKMVMKLKTQGPDGQNPTMEQALKRNAWVALGVLSIIPIVGGFIGTVAQLAASIYIIVTINNNAATRQGWHDEFAGGTKVIKIG